MDGEYQSDLIPADVQSGRPKRAPAASGCRGKGPRVGESTGWIFGTFVYDGSRAGTSPFQKLVPVGLSWSDDGHEKSLLEKQGSFINPRLRSTVINHELLEPSTGTDWRDRAYVRHHGLGGRLNGPVDNLSSSCISCHGRAGVAANRSVLRCQSSTKRAPSPTRSRPSTHSSVQSDRARSLRAQAQRGRRNRLRDSRLLTSSIHRNAKLSCGSQAGRIGSPRDSCCAWRGPAQCRALAAGFAR